LGGIFVEGVGACADSLEPLVSRAPLLAADVNGGVMVWWLILSNLLTLSIAGLNWKTGRRFFFEYFHQLFSNVRLSGVRRKPASTATYARRGRQTYSAEPPTPPLWTSQSAPRSRSAPHFRHTRF